jgi:hypothetical protein
MSGALPLKFADASLSTTNCVVKTGLSPEKTKTHKTKTREKRNLLETGNRQEHLDIASN